MGKDKVELVKLLQKHNVVVRGGPEDGQKFIDALLVSFEHPFNLPVANSPMSLPYAGLQARLV